MDIIPDITTKEVAARIKRMKQDSAAGPDGILKKHVAPQITQEILRLFYCLITACGLQPSMWKEHRTTLLLKQGKDPAIAENYRPVTIGSIVSRVYWGILDRKIRARINFTPRQKGFVYEAGCFNDVHILCETIKLAKVRNGLVAVQLDISKAFDTIPHEAIEDSLTKKGIPKYLAEMIRGSYKDITTNISGGEAEVPMQIKRGVKQGDPLSPFIFNAILEPLLLELENTGGFPINQSCSVSTLAFADDIFLLAEDLEKAKEQLSRTENYLEGLNMKISAEKCTAFRICTRQDSWFLEDPTLQTNDGTKIPYAGADTTLRYLGGKISPWKGLVAEGVEEDFRTTLKRVETTALKPHQKINLISAYIVPQFIYTLVLALVPVTTVRRLDQELRRSIKSILHLPQCTTNGMVYAKKSDGGLGVPKLETTVVSSALKMGLKFMDSEDPVMRAICDESQLKNRLKRIALAGRIAWPINGPEVIDRFKLREKRKEVQRWASLRSQGKAVHAFKDSKIANAWLITRAHLSQVLTSRPSK
jgi:hypothetical protein